MKRGILVVMLVAMGFVIGALVAARREAAQHARDQGAQRAAWEAEKAALESALGRARARRVGAAPPLASSARVEALETLAPEALLEQLASLNVVPGDNRGLRQALALLEQLRQIGPPALPAIGRFLASGQDAVYVPPRSRGARDIKSLADALVPATLRFGLFDVARQIGGAGAEALLADMLGRTGRGVEVACLALALEEMAPGRYRELAAAAARNVLPASADADRDYLYAVLHDCGDASYVTTAESQLVRADGQVDRGALRYLQQTLGEQSVAIAARYYADARLAGPGVKEPLARLALAYVGANQRAAELFHTAVLDQSLLPDQKRELVEDLNQDGLSNKRTPTADDLRTIANRYALTQAYLEQDYVRNDEVLNAAFREADKDLRNMLQKAAASPAPAGQ